MEENELTEKELDELLIGYQKKRNDSNINYLEEITKQPFVSDQTIDYLVKHIRQLEARISKLENGYNNKCNHNCPMEPF